MRAECFGQSRPQDGRQQSHNQDAFVIGRQPIAWTALCDGAGNAQSVAKRALALLETRVREASLADLLREATWRGWAKGLDSALLGGAQATSWHRESVSNERCDTDDKRTRSGYDRSRNGN